MDCFRKTENSLKHIYFRCFRSKSIPQYPRGVELKTSNQNLKLIIFFKIPSFQFTILLLYQCLFSIHLLETIFKNNQNAELYVGFSHDERYFEIILINFSSVHSTRL